MNDLHDDSTNINNKGIVKKPKRYYGVSALLLLVCNIIYLIPHWDHYKMGGLQGLLLLCFLFVIILVFDTVFLFIIAAILRKVMNKSWSKWVIRIGIGAVFLFLAVNIYRSTLPLPYLQLMIDKIPEAVEYFNEHEDEFNRQIADNDYTQIFFQENIPIGPMVNMEYIYVSSLENYPIKTGQISRTEYIYPINDSWYLFLYQGEAI